MTRQSPRAYFSNWREFGAPLAAKVRLAVRNTVRRAELRSNCCGSPGEPGC